MPRVRKLRADQNEVARHVRGEKAEQRDEAERVDITRYQGETRVFAWHVIELRRESRNRVY